MKIKDETVFNIDAMHVDAFRFGVESGDGAANFIIEFGEKKLKNDSEEYEIKPLTSAVLNSDNLKMLLYQIIEIGLKYDDNFWSDIFEFKDKLEDGDINES